MEELELRNTNSDSDWQEKSDFEKSITNKLSEDEGKNYMLYIVLGGVLLVCFGFIIFIVYKNFCQRASDNEDEEIEGEIQVRVG